MKPILLTVLLLWILHVAAATSSHLEFIEDHTTHRPDWLIGAWRSDPHTLDLETNGSCSFRFFPTLSGEFERVSVSEAATAWSVWVGVGTSEPAGQETADAFKGSISSRKPGSGY